VTPETRILIADDDPDLLFTLGAQPAADGYTVQAPPNGRIALALAERVLPHLAVVDLVMPVMDGFELARRLRQRLGDDPEAPPYLVSERGLGYRLRRGP
jgi:DNA-binding response OmpR family regulator